MCVRLPGKNQSSCVCKRRHRAAAARCVVSLAHFGSVDKILSLFGLHKARAKLLRKKGAADAVAAVAASAPGLLTLARAHIQRANFAKSCCKLNKKHTHTHKLEQTPMESNIARPLPLCCCRFIMHFQACTAKAARLSLWSRRRLQLYRLQPLLCLLRIVRALFMLCVYIFIYDWLLLKLT